LECGLGIFKGSRIRMAWTQLPAPVKAETPYEQQQQKQKRKKKINKFEN